MKRLGIIGAMEVEVSLLREQLEAPSASQRAGMTFWSGLLRGMPVVIVPCGVGKVNAALCVQVMADFIWRDPCGEYRHCRFSGRVAGDWRDCDLLRRDVS